MKKIPYGVNNFEKVITQDFYFIDKTKYIEYLEGEGAPYLVFLRPRRFGKSLFLDVLQKYYDVNYKEKFDKLFGNLYIGKNPTKNKNSYYVLKFDFSGVKTDSRDVRIIEKNFDDKVYETILKFLKEYKLDLDIARDDLSASAQLYRLISNLAPIKNIPRLYVLIDEYDHFTNNVLSFDTPSFKDIVSKDGYFRAFFEVLKEGTNSVIDRIFITGVSPITLDSLTSGFNISSNITLDMQYHNMLGFTQEEVNFLLSDLKQRCNLSDNQIINLRQNLRFYYDGYIFTNDLDYEFIDKYVKRLYNPDMLFYFLKDYVKFCRPPKILIDSNIVSDYDKIEAVIKFAKKEDVDDIINQLLTNKEINTKLETLFRFKLPLENYQVISLLFYLGLLTIKSIRGTSFKMTFPNYVIENLYYRFFTSLLKQDYKIKIDYNLINDLTTNIAYDGDYKSLIYYISNILEQLSNRDYIRFTETNIKLVIFSLFSFSNVYRVISEFEIGGRYIDLLLLGREEFKVEYNYVFEFKYIKKEDFSEQLLAKKKAEGIKQLAEYKSLLEKEGYKIDKYILVVFCGYEVKVLEEV